MNLLVPHSTQPGSQLLAAHLASLELEVVPARERLEELLGSELARKLLFALAAPRQQRRAA